MGENKVLIQKVWVGFLLGVFCLAGCTNSQVDNGDYPIEPVPFTSVKVTDNFWGPRIQRNYKVTIPIAIKKSKQTGRIKNFKVAGGIEEGTFSSRFRFDDSDVFKIIEGASYSLQTFPDEQLEAQLDTLVHYISKAQEKDGYLYTVRTILGDSAFKVKKVGDKRWELVREGSHELYNLGHLFEAAVAHYRATGKKDLLNVATKAADLVDKRFGPNKLTEVPGHQEIEIGLVKLYRVTGEERYLKLSKFFLDRRGKFEDPDKHGRKYAQDHKPVVEQDKAVGHAVRAGYMYSAMVDIAAMTNAEDYEQALDKLWENVVSQKLYITGGVGAQSSGESFGENYQLPNMTAYSETCASIANVFWNHRMFLLKGEAKYYDVLERTLYNGVIAGVSLSGDRFFYPNPLASQGQHERSEWFGVACCPSNTSRFTPSVPGYVYAKQGDNLFVNLFMANESEINLENHKVQVTQKTNYPWSGEVDMEINPDKARDFKLFIRIPGWAHNEVVPSDLYTFQENIEETPEYYVNGKKVEPKIRDGYAVISKKWERGDQLKIDMPMPVRKVKANPKVDSDRNRIALQRGPLVYALEGKDNQGYVSNLMIEKNAKISVHHRPDLLKGIYTLTGPAKGLWAQDGASPEEREFSFTAIPYYAWNNRGPDEMGVWMPVEKQEVRPVPVPTKASVAKITASTHTKNIRALNDQMEPDSSDFEGMIRTHWWPKKDQTKWVQYNWDKAKTLSKAKVYWFDDRPYGGVRIPESWRILYKSKEGWKPVDVINGYSVTKDAYDEVSFNPVNTRALRLEVQLPKDNSSGILEWIVG